MNRRLAIGVTVLAVLLAILAWQNWPRQAASKLASRHTERAWASPRVESADRGDPLQTPLFAPRASAATSDADAELLARVQADDRYNLVCHLSDAVSAPMTVQFTDEDDHGGVALLIADQAWMIVAASAGSATMKPDGLAPIPFSWTGVAESTRGICSPDPLVLAVNQRSAVVGVVTNAGDRDEGDVTVEGCGGRALVDEDGGFYLEGFAGDCRVQALRRDGVFYARSPAVDVHLEPGQETRVDLTIPARRTAGLGIAIGKGDGGVMVMDLIEGGAAAEAGLHPGDVIVGLDGEPLADVPLEDFQEKALGEAGTKASLVVRGPDGEEREVTLDRRSID
jgi:hypothetical protein